MKAKYFHFLTLAVWTFALPEEPFCSNKCQRTGAVSFRNCYCDEDCSIFDDCCVDSKHFGGRFETPTTVGRQRDISCKVVGPKRNAYVIGSCSKDWKGPDFIHTLCTSMRGSSTDPVGEVFATNFETGITYENYYCAVCNSDVEKLLLWQIRIDCPFHPNVLLDRTEAMQYIFYNGAVGKWGYLIRDDFNDEATFYGCNVTSRPPKSVAESVRECYPDTVNQCSPSWKDGVIRRMCGTYTDPVYANGTRYKNFYCAICNRVDHSLMTCGEAIGPRHGGSPEETNDSFNFALLLDINLADGNNVGKKSAVVSCKRGEVYDPFAKRCRNIVCAVPGYFLKNGRCSLESPSTHHDP